MNAPFQDGLLQGEALEGEAAERNESQDGLGSEVHDGSVGQRAVAEQLKETKQKNEDQEEQGSTYRTRWMVWCIITTGLAVSLAAVLLRGGAVEWFMLSVLSMIMIVSGLVPILAAAGLSAVRVLSHEQTREGGQLEIHLTFKRSFLIPFVWIAIYDETINSSSPADHRVSVRAVLIPMFRQEMTYRYTLHKLRRGRHPYEHISVSIGDWLGLTAIQKRIAAKAEFVVLPGLSHTELAHQTEQARGSAIYAVPSLVTNGAQDLLGDAAREEIKAAVRAAGIGPDSRPYREGDSLRHLDWRSAAKGRGLQTKTYPLELPVKTFIAVDTLASAYDKDDRLFDACLGWAALALTQAASLGNAVTLLLGQGGTVLQSPIDGGTHNGLAGMLHEMAVLRANGKGSLAGSLAQESNTHSRGSTILVFTADWRGGRSWGELAGFAGEQGCRLELFIVTRSNVPSFAMREQQKWLESGGVKVTWLPVPASMSKLPYAEEGGEEHEFA